MGARKLGLSGFAVAVLALGGSAPAARADATQARAAAENLATASFGVRDDQDVALDALEVLQVGPSRYVGVSHAYVGDRYQVRLSTSSDLSMWHFERTLAQDGSMPAIAAAPGGGFVVSDERGSTLRVLPPIVLPASVTGPTNLWVLQKSQLRFRFYPSLTALLAGAPDKTFIAPRRLSRTNEGTPSINVFRDGPGVGGLRVETGLHYFKDLTGDGLPDADRQATGTMRGFRRWNVVARPDLDRLFLGQTTFHPGFTAPVAGNIGDRDDVVLPDGESLTVAEGQYDPGNVGSWRLFLRRTDGGPVVPLLPASPGGSRSFGNAALTLITLPDGRPGLLFTAFIFGCDSGPGEAGTVVNVLPLA
jgi:hypothetical protein